MQGYILSLEKKEWGEVLGVGDPRISKALFDIHGQPLQTISCFEGALSQQNRFQKPRRSRRTHMWEIHPVECKKASRRKVKS